MSKNKVPHIGFILFMTIIGSLYIKIYKEENNINKNNNI